MGGTAHCLRAVNERDLQVLRRQDGGAASLSSDQPAAAEPAPRPADIRGAVRGRLDLATAERRVELAEPLVPLGVDLLPDRVRLHYMADPNARLDRFVHVGEY